MRAGVAAKRERERERVAYQSDPQDESKCLHLSDRGLFPIAAVGSFEPGRLVWYTTAGRSY